LTCLAICSKVDGSSKPIIVMVRTNQQEKQDANVRFGGRSRGRAETRLMAENRDASSVYAKKGTKSATKITEQNELIVRWFLLNPRFRR